MLILILSIIALILIVLFISLMFNKVILDSIGKACQDLRKFISEYTGIFTVLFIVLFFIEQIVLVILVFYFRVDAIIQMIISIFALVVVTTATFQKFIWEYKYQNITKEIIKTTVKNKMFLLNMKNLIDEIVKLRDENKKLKMKLKK